MHVGRQNTKTSMISVSNSTLTPRLENTTPVECIPGVAVELEPVVNDDEKKTKKKNKKKQKQKKTKQNRKTKHKVIKLNL